MNCPHCGDKLFEFQNMYECTNLWCDWYDGCECPICIKWKASGMEG